MCLFFWFFFLFFFGLKITPTSSQNQQHHTERHTHTCTQTEHNPISCVFMDEGVESEVQWPAGSQRPKNTEKDRGGIGVEMERGELLFSQFPERHFIWASSVVFSLGAFNWLANNKNNTSLWKGKPLPGKTTVLSRTRHLCHVTKRRSVSCHTGGKQWIFLVLGEQCQHVVNWVEMIRS